MTNKKLSVSIVLLIILCLSATAVNASFVGSAKSNKYHYDYCEWGQKIAAHNLIVFSSVADAQNSGYVPCKVCQPPTSSSVPTTSSTPASSYTPTTPSAPDTSSVPAAAPADDTFRCWNCNGVSSRSNAQNCDVCGWDMCTVCNMCSPSCEKHTDSADTDAVTNAESTVIDTKETVKSTTGSEPQPINEAEITNESASETTNTTSAEITEDISDDKSDSNTADTNAQDDASTDTDNNSGYIISGILLLGSGYLLKRKFSKK